MTIELVHAAKSYPVPGGHGERIRALQDATVSFRPGELSVIYGPSGSGKSTLLALAGGMTFPDSGSVRWSGTETGKIARLSRVRGEKIAYLFQDAPAFRELTVLENLLFQIGTTGKGTREEAGKLLELLDLAERFDCLPSPLSGGEKRRLGLAAVLLRASQYLILDEPGAFLDAAWQARIAAILQERVAGQGVGVVIASHDEIFCRNASRVYEIRGGCVQSLAPEKILR